MIVFLSVILHKFEYTIEHNFGTLIFRETKTACCNSWDRNAFAIKLILCHQQAVVNSVSEEPISVESELRGFVHVRADRMNDKFRI